MFDRSLMFDVEWIQRVEIRYRRVPAIGRKVESRCTRLGDQS